MFLPQTLRQKKVRLFTITDMILIRTVSETEAQNGYLNRTVDTLFRFTTSELHNRVTWCSERSGWDPGQNPVGPQ